MVTGPLVVPSADRWALMKESSLPPFQLSCCVTQSCEMSLVSSPFSAGGLFSRLNGCR